MQEYLFHPLDDLLLYPINSIGYQKELVSASFCCANISTVNSILRRLESYDGVNKVDSIMATSETKIYQDWLKSQIDKRITSQKYLSPSAATTTTTEDT